MKETPTPVGVVGISRIFEIFLAGATLISYMTIVPNLDGQAITVSLIAGFTIMSRLSRLIKLAK